MAKRKNPIKIKPGDAGQLRKAAGAKKGQRIPAGKLQKLAKSKNSTTRRRAVSALNARGFKHPTKKG